MDNALRTDIAGSLVRMRAVPPIAATQFGVFSSAQALRSGWTSHALRHATQTGALLRLRAGIYAPAPTLSGLPHVDDVERLRTAAAAVSVVNRRVTISHAAAATLLGLWLVTIPEQVCATFPRGRRGAMPGVHRHRSRLLPGHVVRDGRVLRTSAARTVVDVGRELGADAAIAVVDSALRTRLTTRTELAAVLAACAGWPGVRASARAIGLAEPRAESALESISRLRMDDQRLPAPAPQTDIIDRTGHFLGRVDFYWDEFGVAGEADGLGKYDDKPLALRDEKTRQGLMEDCGLIFVHWGWGQASTGGPTAGGVRG